MLRIPLPDDPGPQARDRLDGRSPSLDCGRIGRQVRVGSHCPGRRTEDARQVERRDLGLDGRQLLRGGHDPVDARASTQQPRQGRQAQEDCRAHSTTGLGDEPHPLEAISLAFRIGVDQERARERLAAPAGDPGEEPSGSRGIVQPAFEIPPTVFIVSQRQPGHAAEGTRLRAGGIERHRLFQHRERIGDAPCHGQDGRQAVAQAEGSGLEPDGRPLLLDGLGELGLVSGQRPPDPA